MKSALYLLLPLSLLYTCCTSGTIDSTIEPTGNQKDEVNYLALGDSYTVGQSVPNDNFPEQIYDSLMANGININFPQIIARTGWSTTDLLNGLLVNELDVDTFDFVTLCSGVNNQFRNMDTLVYLSEFDTLVRKSISYVGGRSNRVWVLSIPDYAFTPFGRGDTSISEEIDQYNAWNKAIADKYQVNYVNVTDISRLGILNPELVCDDNLHPSGLQYTLWIKKFLPEIKELF